MTYTQRLMRGGSFMTRFAHATRFQTTLDLISGKQYDFVLDYGCADGWFLKLAYQQGLATAGAGVDIVESDLERCRREFEGVSGFAFMHPHAVPDTLRGKCDLAVCTETLEHVAHIDQTLEDIRSLCRHDAVILLSVPIEVGWSLLLKQIGRGLAHAKNPQYEYERYTFRELMQAALFWNVSNFDSSHRRPNVDYRGHKGFDFRTLERRIRQVFSIERTTFSPFPLSRHWLNSTVYWICRVKP